MNILSLEQFQALAEAKARELQLNRRHNPWKSLLNFEYSCHHYQEDRENWFQATKLSSKHPFGLLSCLSAWLTENFSRHDWVLGEISHYQQQPAEELNRLFGLEISPRLILFTPRYYLLPGHTLQRGKCPNLPFKSLALWPGLYAAYLSMLAGMAHDKHQAKQLFALAEAQEPALDFTQLIKLCWLRKHRYITKSMELGTKLCRKNAYPQAMEIMHSLTHDDCYRIAWADYKNRLLT